MLRVRESQYLPAGKHVLMRNGQPVWCGDVGAPTEDVDCDEIVLAPAEYARFQSALNVHNTVAEIIRAATGMR